MKGACFAAAPNAHPVPTLVISRAILAGRHGFNTGHCVNPSWAGCGLVPVPPVEDPAEGLRLCGVFPDACSDAWGAHGAAYPIIIDSILTFQEVDETPNSARETGCGPTVPAPALLARKYSPAVGEVPVFTLERKGPACCVMVGAIDRGKPLRAEPVDCLASSRQRPQVFLSTVGRARCRPLVRAWLPVGDTPSGRRHRWISGGSRRQETGQRYWHRRDSVTRLPGRTQG